MPGLVARITGAVERASTALRLAADPPSGLDLSALEAPLDKVVAEVAILAREVAACPDPALAALGMELAREVAPLARAPRIEVAVALRPSVALDLCVGHILLADLGLAAPRLQEVLGQAWHSPLAGTRERQPHRALEQQWLAALAGLAPRPGAAAVAATAMATGTDLLGVSRDDLYALTHAIAYATDFGRWPVPGADATEVLALCESALAIVLDDDDFDLAAELVMAWPCLGAALSPIAAYAFAVLCDVEDRAGILPSLTLRRSVVEAQPAGLRAAHTVVTSYHTALVMGLACALLLRAGDSVPAAAPLPEGDRQWESVAGAPPEFRRDVALNRALRRADFAAARAALAAGVSTGVAASALAVQVAQMLRRLGQMSRNTVSSAP